jgi:hypothetical protein
MKDEKARKKPMKQKKNLRLTYSSHMWIKHFRYWTLELNPKSLDSLVEVILTVTLSFTPIHAAFTPYPLF